MKMKKRRLYLQYLLIIVLAITALFLSSCGANKARKVVTTYTSLSELEDKRIGMGTGSVQALQAEERFPNAEHYYFSSSTDMLNALRTGKIDAYADAEALASYMMGENPDLAILPEKLADGMKVGAIFPKTEEGRKLCDEYSEFIRKIKENGTYDEIRDAWIGSDESKRIAPDYKNLPGPNGTLSMATDVLSIPFIYIKDGDLAGIDIDLVTRFCREYGYALEPVIMDFPAIVPAVSTGKCDFASGGIAFTDERAESVYFSEPTYEGGSVIAILQDPGASEGVGFWSSIRSSFEKTFIREGRWKLFVEGTRNTLVITILSALFGTILGFALYLFCRKGGKAADKITGLFLWLLRGMPMVVLLMILYYIVFSEIDVNGLIVAIIGFTLTFGAGMYGMLCTGVDAVGTGQAEAALALGYTSRQTFFKIILPQAAAIFMPSYNSQLVSHLKATAVVGYIAVMDLTKMGDIVRSRTYEAFFPLIAVTVIYFILAGVLTRIVDRFTRYTDPKRRPAEEILKGVKTHD